MPNQQQYKNHDRDADVKLHLVCLGPGGITHGIAQSAANGTDEQDSKANPRAHQTHCERSFIGGYGISRNYRRGNPQQRTADTCDAQRQTQHLGRRAKAGATEPHHGEHHANPHDAEQSIATGKPGHTQGADQVRSYVGPADEASQGITNTQIVAHGRQQDTVTETTKSVPDRCRHADQQYDDPAVYPKGFGISHPLRIRHISRCLGEGALVFLTKACDAFRHIRAGPCTVVYLKGQALGQAHAIGTAQ